MHITIVDDEKVLGSKIKKKLENEGYAVSAFYSYEEFMAQGDANSQLYIVDISLGDGSGFDIITWLRGKVDCKAPIMIMSGYGDSEKIIYGLNIGADDYLTKPFVPDELTARVKALLRRPVNMTSQKLLTYKNITFDPSSKEVMVGNAKLHLGHKEKMILEFFMINQEQIISREKLITYIWGGNYIGDVTDNTINVTLSKLRKKVGPQLNLRTMYNHGYILD
ncbi:response regulator transcription factor [Candidatus Gracilibacteria bacterium]|nr:response regulator transcription factor [Candidatus Gracilibacteria bacterium]